MIEFGKSLRNAREAKGYTPTQIADMTHMKSSIVEALENEDFSPIAAPIYGRGFVKLYCEAVGLDPKPYVDEFMAIINGNREATIRERPVTKPDAPISQPPQAPVPPPQPAPAQEQDLFQQDPVLPPDPVAPEPQAATPVTPVTPALPPTDAIGSEPAFSRFAAPMRERAPLSGPSLVNPRMLILSGCICVLLILLLLGIRSLYHATTSDADKGPEVTETPAKPVARDPQKIPSLYID